MKKVYLILTTVLILFNSSLIAQNDNIILKKLDCVKQGKIIDPAFAWVINNKQEKISYNQFKGKWLLIDFWSTGCVPCIKEFPALANFYERNKTKIEVIAVSVDKDFKRYKRSAAKYNIKVPHFYAGFTYNNYIFNLNVKVLKTREGAFKFNTLTPQYVLINPLGKIIDKDIPKPSSSDFKTKLDLYLNEK